MTVLPDLKPDLKPASARSLAPRVRVPVAFGGIGATVPATRVTNADLAATVDTSDEWIVERTGIRERRKLEAGRGVSALAVAAGRRALEDAGIGADAIDLLVVCTCTPDQLLPTAASLVARELGMQCASMDLGAACAGWVYGLITVSSMIGRTADTALLIGAEVMTRMMDPGDRSTLPLFGDGAAAAVLQTTTADGPGLIAWDMGTDPTAADLLRIDGGGSAAPLTPASLEAGDQYLKMEGREVFRRAVRAVEGSCRNVLTMAGVDPGDVALFVPHQANSRIVDAIVPRLGLDPARTIINIDRYGNTSAASVPIALCEAAETGRLAPGDLVLISGFGAGMTWASALIRWGYSGVGPAATEILS